MRYSKKRTNGKCGYLSNVWKKIEKKRTVLKQKMKRMIILREL
ncbi:hypothetical protein HMPREF9999_01112 [Alloprevotella sp. oral taxon 473 str. F0040]|nr:hypothetical protein HMPREF9999_01112 [Alloprevotella sp. oral taxon 473 str. F0040]